MYARLPWLPWLLRLCTRCERCNWQKALSVAVDWMSCRTAGMACRAVSMVVMAGAAVIVCVDHATSETGTARSLSHRYEGLHVCILLAHEQLSNRWVVRNAQRKVLMCGGDRVRIQTCRHVSRGFPWNVIIILKLPAPSNKDVFLWMVYLYLLQDIFSWFCSLASVDPGSFHFLYLREQYHWLFCCKYCTVLSSRGVHALPCRPRIQKGQNQSLEIHNLQISSTRTCVMGKAKTLILKIRSENLTTKNV